MPVTQLQEQNATNRVAYDIVWGHQLDISTFAYETTAMSRSVGNLSPNDATPHPDKNGNQKKSEIWGFHEGKYFNFCLLSYETVQNHIY